MLVKLARSSGGTLVHLQPSAPACIWRLLQLLKVPLPWQVRPRTRTQSRTLTPPPRPGRRTSRLPRLFLFRPDPLSSPAVLIYTLLSPTQSVYSCFRFLRIGNWELSTCILTLCCRLCRTLRIFYFQRQRPFFCYPAFGHCRHRGQSSPVDTALPQRPRTRSFSSALNTHTRSKRIHSLHTYIKFARNSVGRETFCERWASNLPAT